MTADTLDEDEPAGNVDICSEFKPVVKIVSQQKTEELKSYAVSSIVFKDDSGVTQSQRHLELPQTKRRHGSCGSNLPEPEDSKRDVETAVVSAPSSPRKKDRQIESNTSKSRVPWFNRNQVNRHNTAPSKFWQRKGSESPTNSLVLNEVESAPLFLVRPDNIEEDALNKGDSPSVNAIPGSNVIRTENVNDEWIKTSRVNEEVEELPEESNDGYLVICSRNRAVVIQVDLPNFHICARYSFQSQVLAAQIIHRGSGKEGLVTVSENGRCTIFRLMDLHVLESRDLKMPMLINLMILPVGRYVAVSKRMEFWHGHFFETPVKLSLFPNSLGERDEIKDEPLKVVPHKREASMLFSLFQRKTETVDCWDEALKSLLLSRPPLQKAPSSRRHQSNLSSDEIKFQRSKTDYIKHRPTKSTITDRERRKRHTISSNRPASGRQKAQTAPKDFNENLEKMNERGDRIRHLADKSVDLNDSALRFADLAKQLRKKNQGSWW